MFASLYLAFLIIMLFQGLLSIYFSIYIWEDPNRLKQIQSPKKFEPAKNKFSLLIPARLEENVLGRTLATLASINYTTSKFEVIVICENHDHKTIKAAQQVIHTNKLSNFKITTFSDQPINKPHALNVGLSVAKHPIVSIIDAEDEVHPDLLNVANTLYIRQNPDIIQAGVQLMNYASRWFSSHNVLEYYFWFKSRMHLHARVGMMPLGGNTVFFKAAQVRKNGGWDESCLAEDAEIGVRLSATGAKCLATYDASHVTREETPATVGQFIRQRTRWNQGFIQVLFKGHWTQYNSFWKKTLCIYTLSFPITQSILFFFTPAIFVMGMLADLPFIVSLFSFIPLFLLAIQFTVNIVALQEFTKEQHLSLKFLVFPLMLLTFIPYQMLLGISAIRATLREIRGINNWEKTTHKGIHRHNLSLALEI